MNELNKVRSDMLAKVKQFAEVIEKCEQFTAAPGALDKLDLAGCDELERQLKMTMEAVDIRKVGKEVYADMQITFWMNKLYDLCLLLNIHAHYIPHTGCYKVHQVPNTLLPNPTQPTASYIILHSQHHRML